MAVTRVLTRTRSILTALTLSILLASCQQHAAPEIIQLDSQLVHTYDVQKESYGKHLEMQLQLSGEPEEYSVSSLLITGPSGSHLQWECEGEQLASVYEDGEWWFAAHEILPPPEEPFPSGTYTLTLREAQGESDAMDFTLRDRLQLSEQSAELFARYEPETTRIRYDGEQMSEVRMRFYDEHLKPIGLVTTTAGSTLNTSRDEFESELSGEPAYLELEVTDPLLAVVFRSGMYTY
ncbi:MAG: hypothetical protein ACQEQU_05595 [Spirochaetota bacterium]